MFGYAGLWLKVKCYESRLFLIVLFFSFIDDLPKPVAASSMYSGQVIHLSWVPINIVLLWKLDLLWRVGLFFSGCSLTCSL